MLSAKEKFKINIHILRGSQPMGREPQVGREQHGTEPYNIKYYL